MILGIDGRLANALRPAGAGHYCREALRALGALERDVTLRIYLDAPPREEFPTSRECVRVLPAGRFWTHRILAVELRRDPPDVFFSPVPQLPWRCPCPSLVTVLDLAAWSHPESFPWAKRTVMKLQAQHAIRNASHVIAISQCTANDVMGHFGVNPERITVVPLGVDDRFFEVATPPPGTMLDQFPDRYVLYLGQLQPRKNLVRLIDAFGQVLERHPDLPHGLALVGGLGWKNEAIYRAAEASPVADRIRYFDYVPDALVPAQIARAEVLALVSLSEGFGLPALEAMAAGTAVLAANCSSLPEVVGDAGVLVDPENVDAIADGLARLLLDEKLRTQCVDSGRKRARLFRWKDTANTILDAAKGLTSRD